MPENVLKMIKLYDHIFASTDSILGVKYFELHFIIDKSMFSVARSNFSEQISLLLSKDQKIYISDS